MEANNVSEIDLLPQYFIECLICPSSFTQKLVSFYFMGTICSCDNSTDTNCVAFCLDLSWDMNLSSHENTFRITVPLQWRHNERDGVANHQHHDSLLYRLFRRISKKTSKLRVTGLCEGNSPVTGEFPAQKASNAENVSIWWCHHNILHYYPFMWWTQWSPAIPVYNHLTISKWINEINMYALATCRFYL